MFLSHPNPFFFRRSIFGMSKCFRDHDRSRIPPNKKRNPRKITHNFSARLIERCCKPRFEMRSLRLIFFDKTLPLIAIVCNPVLSIGRKCCQIMVCVMSVSPQVAVCRFFVNIEQFERANLIGMEHL